VLERLSHTGRSIRNDFRMSESGRNRLEWGLLGQKKRISRLEQTPQFEDPKIGTL
jgi:hypothetical protein